MAALTAEVTAEETLAPAPRRRVWIARLWRGPEADPRWARPALLVLLTATALLYLWGLAASGWANSYYSAAVQAGTRSWKAFFYGSTDASSFITVDKTPASLWIMALSARVFGLSSWSVLAPQAISGVLTVGVLYAAVKRWFSPAAGLVAGAVCALTPVAVLMFRFNNPDALLVLLLVVGAYAMTRAVESGRSRWLVTAGVAVGFAFLAKELQAFLVLPAFGVTYLLAGPPRFGRRIVQLVWLGLSTLVAGGWWVAIVSAVPATSRPYIGGSQDNTFFDVLFGYNGLGRLTGNETGSVGGVPGPGGGSMWGETGWTRLFNGEYGGQASWLIPSALVILAAGLCVTVRRPRTDRTRAALVLWGGWLLTTGLAISLSQGIIHPYYTVALAPAIGAVIGIGGAWFWRARAHWHARVVLATATALATWWSLSLLDRTPTWLPALRSIVLVGGIAATVLLLLPFRRVRVAAAVLAAAIAVSLAGPAAYAVSTARAAHGGALPTAGPAGASTGFGGGPPGPGGGGAPGFGGADGQRLGSPPVGFPGGAPTGGSGFAPPAGFPGGELPTFAGGGAGSPGGRIGGLLGETAVDEEMVRLLQHGAGGYRWTAAAVGANSAGSYQLASGEPIMAIGGFNGSDPAPTLAEFQEYVRGGAVHFFIEGGGPGGGGGPGLGGGGTSSEISAWVSESFSSSVVGGVTVYDLTRPTDGG